MTKANKSDRQADINRQTLQIYWQVSLQHRRLLLGTALHPIGMLLLNVAAPFYVGKIIGSFFIAGANHSHYIPYFAVASALGIICNRIGFPSMMALQAHAQADLQARGFDVLLKRGSSFHSNNVSGKLISDMADYLNAYGTLLLAGVGSVVAFAITFLAGSVVIFTQSWQLGLIITAMAVFAFGTSYYESRRRSGMRQRRLVAKKAVTAQFADTISNAQTVKTFAQETREFQEHRRLSAILQNMQLHDWTNNSRQNNDRIIVLLLFQLAFIISLLYLVPHDPALLGIGVFGFTFAFTISNRMVDITLQLLHIEEALLQASPMTEILLQAIEIKDTPGAKPLAVASGAIDLRHVTFHYTDANLDNTVFKELGLSIKAGEKVGLVGPSGGGKSTLTRLLLRFEDIDDGQVLIDGHDIATVTQTSLRQAIAYVPQEPLLFHRSITDNITYGKPDASQAEVIEAAQRAYAEEFINDLPQGYDTVVGERGVKLSGGQRQRIAIARAMLKNAPILVLDEATSALDSESEVYIQKALWELMEGRTALVIAHRLSTIQHLDRIIVMEDGRITEQGTHQQLLKRKGTYARLWAHQSGGFIDG